MMKIFAYKVFDEDEAGMTYEEAKAEGFVEDYTDVATFKSEAERDKEAAETDASPYYTVYEKYSFEL